MCTLRDIPPSAVAPHFTFLLYHPLQENHIKRRPPLGDFPFISDQNMMSRKVEN
jgi:hypothetical protein